MLLLERGYQSAVQARKRKHILIEKNMPQEGMLKVLALAKKEREEWHVR